MDCHFSETSGKLSVPWVFTANHKDSDFKDSHWSVATSTKIVRFWRKFNQKRLSSHTQPGWDIRETIHAGEAFAGAYEYMDHTWSYQGLSSMCLSKSLSISLSPRSGQPQQLRTKSDQKIKLRYTYGGFLKWWYPTTLGFLTRNDHFGGVLGVSPWRKNPYTANINIQTPAPVDQIVGQFSSWDVSKMAS